MKRPLLLPLVPLYAAGLQLRELRLSRGWEPVRRLQRPVISIGNLSTGGSGKTPFAITLARLLSQRGFHVDVLSRGYGRRSAVPLRVHLDGSADEYGDEPLLIAREAGVPVYVAAERYDAGKLAEAESALDERQPHIHILDDGFQHRQLFRDIDILLVNREDWHDRLLPAGNLREPWHAARRASVLAIPSDDLALETELRNWGFAGPIWRLHRHMEIPQVTGPVVAFCGIARSEQFFRGLRAAGVSVSSQVAFADHHPYSASDLERVTSLAQPAGAAALITTQKDRIRLEKLISTTQLPVALETVKLAVSIDDESEVCAWLCERLAARPASLPL